MTPAQKAHELEALDARLENDANARWGYGNGSTLTLIPPEGIALIAPANGAQTATPDSVQLEGDAPRALMFDPPITPATPVLTAALQLARAGFRVVWCRPRQKRPMMTKWPKIATSDPIKVDDQYARLPLKKGETPNLGIACGECDLGFIVAVDVDDAARLAQLEAEHGVLPPTLTGRSPKGARLFYLIPPGARTDLILRNLVGIGGKKGVDLRVAGGQVVVGPSVHPDLSATGELQHYTWDVEQLPLATLPDTWVRAVTEPIAIPKWVAAYTPQSMKADAKAQKRAEKYLEKAVCGEAVRVAGCGEGRRNNTLHDALCNVLPLAVGLMLHNGRAYAERELSSAARSAGLPEREIATTIASVRKWMLETGASRVPDALATERDRPAHSSLALVRHEPAGEGDEAEREAIAREEQELEDWDGNEATEPGRHVRVSTIDFIQSKGSPANCAENVARLLAHEPAWNRGPRYDRFSRTVRWPSPLPEPIAKIQRSGLEVRKSDMAKIQASAIAFDLQVGLETVDAGVSLHADQNSYDSLSDWLRSLTWDGTARLDTWVPKYLGCADTPMHRASGSSFLRGWVQRQLIPGEVVDLVPILQGPQNAGKNRAIATLFATPPDVPKLVATMQLFDPNHKDMPRFACSRAVIFIDEFRGDTRTMDAVKTWISATNDQWVEKYEKHAGTYDRRAMLIGATNQTAYLVDPSGARRFYPWKIGAIDIDALARDRDQLLAEAVARGGDWREGLDDGAVKAELDATREDAHEVDPLAERLAHLAATGGWTGPLKIADFTRLLNLTAKDELGDPRYATRFGTAARRIGAVCERTTAANIRVYHPPGCSCAAGRARNLHP